MNTNELVHLLFLIALPVVWFAPGFFLRRMLKKRAIIAKAEEQAKAVERLYPKGKSI